MVANDPLTWRTRDNSMHADLASAQGCQRKFGAHGIGVRDMSCWLENTSRAFWWIDHGIAKGFKTFSAGWPCFGCLTNVVS